MNKQALKDLMNDIVVGKGMASDYSVINKTLREQMVEIIGTDRPTMRDMRKPEASALFELVEEWLGAEIPKSIQEDLQFAEYANVAWGQKRKFNLENPDLFNVAVVASGNGNVERQRMQNGSVEVTTAPMAIKIWANFKQYISGDIDFPRMVEKVKASYLMKIKELIWVSFFTTPAYNSDTTYNVADTGGINADNIDTLADHVSASNGQAKVMIVASKAFIKAYVGTTLSDGMLDELNKKGYVEMFNGNILMPVEHMHKANTDTFIFDNNTAILLPVASEKIVKIVEEGNPIIMDAPLNINGDMSKEYLYYVEVGVAVAVAKKYGRYTYTA